MLCINIWAEIGRKINTLIQTVGIAVLLIAVKAVLLKISKLDEGVAVNACCLLSAKAGAIPFHESHFPYSDLSNNSLYLLIV